MVVKFDGGVIAFPIKLRDILGFRGRILMESVLPAEPAATGRSMLLRVLKKRSLKVVENRHGDCRAG